MKDLFPHYAIGHFINQPNNPTNFEVTRFEEMEELDIEDPHKHTFYEILWFEEGLSAQTIDYQTYTIEPKTFFFISPNQLHHFEEWQTLKGGSVFFTEDFFLLDSQDKDKLFEISFLDNLHTNPFLKPDEKTYHEIVQTIELMITEKKRADSSPAILRSLLHILITQIQRSIDKKGVEHTNKHHIVVYKKLKNLIEKHFKSNLKADDYAKMLNLSQHHLNFIAKKVTHKTTSDLIRARSILEAKRLLTFTEMPVSDIAATLSYFDLSYFGKVFRAETQQSPIEFRKAISEKYRNL
jgi:AraC family transcriptional regulator, transcriptional activator of pobA